MAENAIPQQKQHQMQRFQLQHLLRIFARQVVFQQHLVQKSFYHRAGLGVQDHLAGTLQRLLYFGRVATHHAGKYICFPEHDNALAAGFALVTGAVGVARSHNKQVARFQVPLALVDGVGAGAAFQVKNFAISVGVLVRHAEHRAVQSTLYININSLLLQFFRRAGVGVVLHRFAFGTHWQRRPFIKL